MANVSGQSAEDVSSQLTAIWNNFYDGSKSLEYYTDVMVKLGATTASSSDEIAQGIQKFAAVSGTVGLSYEYAASALATLTANTRESADVVGNALKTLFARVQGLQLGETLEDGTDLNKYSKALYDVGVNIKAQNGDLKEMDQILDEVAAKWKTLDRGTQNALAQTVAGVRQYTQFVALMDNWDDFEKNLTTAYNAGGALGEQAEIYAESWKAARDRVRASAQDIYDSLINPDFYIEVDKVISPILSGTADVVDAMGGMQGVLSVLALLMNKVYGQQIAQSMRDMATSLGFMTGQQQEQARNLQAQATELSKVLAYQYGDNAAINMKISSTQKLVELQGQVAGYVDQLTPKQQEVLQHDMQHAQSLHELINQYSDMAVKAEQAFDVAKNGILESKNATGELSAEQKKVLNGLNGYFTQLKNLSNNKVKVKIDTTDADKAISSIIKALEKLVPKAQGLKQIEIQLSNLADKGKGASQEVLELAKSFGFLSKNAELGKAEAVKFFGEHGYPELLKHTESAVDSLSNKLKTVFNIDQASVSKYIESLKTSDANTRALEETVKRLEDRIQELENKLKSGAYQAEDWASTLVRLGTSLSQVSMGINSMQNIGEIFTDSELSGTEKALRSFTSLGMLFPIVGNSMKELKNITNLASLGSIAHTAAMGAEAAGASTLAASMTGVGAAVSAALGPIMAIVTITSMVIALINSLPSSEERAIEAIDKATESFEEQNNKLKELNNELQATQEKLKELGEQGTLSLVEEDELRQLKEQEASLQRQIELQEKLVQNERQAQASAINKNFEQSANSLKVKPDYNREVFRPTTGSFDIIDVDTWWNDIQLGKNAGLITNKEFEQYEQQRLKWIEDNEKVLSDWIFTNSEAIANAEANYLNYIQAIEDGVIKETQEVKDRIAEMQQFLHDYVRTPMYSESEYQEIYIKPVIDNNSSKEFFITFYEDGKKAVEGLLDDTIKNSLRRAGVTNNEFLAYIENTVNKAKDRITKVFNGNFALMEDFFQELSDEDINIVASMQLEDEASFEDFYRKLMEIKSSEHIPINISLGEAIQAASEALKTIAEGEFLDDEAIENLKDKFTGIYDLASLEAMSLYDQARMIGEAMTVAYHPDVLASELNGVIKDYKDNLEEISKQAQDASRGLTIGERRENKQLMDLKKQEIEVELNLDEAEKQLDELNEFKIDDLEVDIDQSYIDAILGQMGAIQKAASLIGEGFKVEAKNVESLMKTMPQLFEDAVVDAETGMVQLSQAIIDKVAETANAEIAIRADSLQDILSARIAETQDEIDILNELKRISIENSSQAARQEAIDANFTKEEKQKSARAIIQAKIQQSLQERSESATTASRVVQDENKVTDSSVEEGKRFSENWRLAGQNMYNALNEAFHKASLDMQKLANGEIVNLAQNTLAAISTAGFSKGSSQYSWDYEDVKEDFSTSALKNYIKDFNINDVTGGNELLKDNALKAIQEALDDYGFDLSYEDILKGNVNPIINVANNRVQQGNVDRALSDSYYELATDITNLSKLFSGQHSIDNLKDSGRGKGNKQQLKDLDDIKERYHEINRQIERQDDLLDDISNNIERTYGISKLKNYARELDALTAQQDNYNKKLEEAESWMNFDTNVLEGLFNNIQYDEKDEILNYTSLLQQAVEEYNATVLTAGEEEAKALQELYDKRIQALQQYEKTINELRTIRDQLQENARAIQDNKLSIIEYKLEVVLDVKSMKDALRDFDKNLQETFGDALTHGTGAMNKLGITNRPLNVAELTHQQAQAEANLYPSYLSQFNDLKALYAEANDQTDRDRIIQDIKDLQGKVLDSAEAIVEWANSIEDIIPDAVAAAAERYSTFTNQLEHNTTVVDTIRELYALQGVTYKTAEGFAKLQNTSNEKLEAQVAEAKLQKAWYDEALAKLTEAQSRLDSLNGDEGDLRYDTYKKARDAYLEEFNQAQEAYLSLAQQAMETARDMYLEQIDKAVYDFGQKVSGGIGLDLMQDKYNHYIEEDDRYFDKVNEAYQTLSWYNKLQADIDNATSDSTRKHLKALQEEIDIRREGGKLSQYDLDILNAKYEVLQAQMALEDAQNAKNDVKLVRDRQGNWNYQYVANPEDIADKEKDLLDAQIEWYNIAKQQVNDVTGEIISTWQECQDKIKEIYSDMTLTDQERSDRAAEIYKYYSDKIKYLEEEKQVAIKDMNEAGNFNLISGAQIAGAELADQAGLTADQVKEISQLSWDDILELVTNGNDKMKELMESNATFVDIFDNTYAKDLSNMTTNTENFEETLRNTLDEAQNRFNDYGDKVQEVAENTGTTLEDLTDTTDQVSDSTDQLADSGLDAADVLWDLISAADDAAISYANMAQEIWGTVEALRALAQQQMEYVHNAAGGETYNDLDGRDEDIKDYSYWLAQKREQGEDIFGSDYDKYWDERAEKRGPDANSLTNTQLSNLFKKADNGDINAQKVIQAGLNGEGTFHELIKKYGVRLATGGYTGEFDDEKLAFLHEKELVLNQTDTKNILDAVGIVRDLGAEVFASIERVLDNNVAAVLASMGRSLDSSIQIHDIPNQTDNTYHIDRIEFPGITDPTGLEEAIRSLPDQAAQWARIRKGD